MPPTETTSNVMEPEKLARGGMSKIIAFSILGILVLAAGGAYYYWIMPMQIEAENKRYKGAYESLHVPHHAGDLNSAISAGRELLETAPTPTWAAQTQLIIAHDLYTRNNEGDRAEAYTIYKSIVASENVFPLHRALALAEMTFNAHMAGNPSFATTYLFNDGSYAEILTKENDNVQNAFLRMYEWSDDVYPNAFAKIQIALILGQQLSSEEVTDEAQAETARSVQTYVGDADALLGIRYDKGRLAQLHLSRAMALWMSSKVLGNIAPFELENDVSRTETIAREENSVHGAMVLNLAKILRAMILQDSKKAAEAKDVLIALANDIAAGDPKARQLMTSYFGGVGAREPNDLIRTQFVDLARISPEFKTLLKSSGWAF